MNNGELLDKLQTKPGTVYLPYFFYLIQLGYHRIAIKDYFWRQNENEPVMPVKKKRALALLIEQSRFF